MKTTGLFWLSLFCVVFPAVTGFAEIDVDCREYNGGVDSCSREIMRLLEEGAVLYQNGDSVAAQEFWRPSIESARIDPRRERTIDVRCRLNALQALRGKDFVKALAYFAYLNQLNPFDTYNRRFFLLLSRDPSVRVTASSPFRFQSTNRFQIDYIRNESVGDWTESWRLTIQDPQARKVKEIRGKGRPPAEIVWKYSRNDFRYWSDGLVRCQAVLTLVSVSGKEISAEPVVVEIHL